MSLRRRDLERGLLRAERVISLTERCRPLDADEEYERVLSAWQRGHEVTPKLRHEPAQGLAELRALLDGVAERARNLGPWGALYAARAEELGIEAELAEHVGASDFRLRAARRYPVEAGPDGERAARWARRWASFHAGPELEASHPSDDDRDPLSLFSVMQRAVGEARLPFRVLVRPGLLSAAATGDGVILVRGAARYRAGEARRIVAHEIQGHALPRARAQVDALGLFSLGTARGSDDEEGRAVLIEQRIGALGRTRKAELGRRHLAGLAVRQGASFIDVVRMLRQHGAEPEDAVLIALRVHRGGGLARELVYLTAFSRVRCAFEADPDAERWLERGRISVASVPLLVALGEAPEWMLAKRAA